jgi:hypothetical protein
VRTAAVLKRAASKAPLALYAVWVAGFIIFDDWDYPGRHYEDAYQWAAAILAWGWYSSLSYKNLYLKGGVLLVLLWTLWIALTDRILSSVPGWVLTVEAFLFMGWFLYVSRRTKRLESLPEAQEYFRDDGVAGNRQGRGRPDKR